MDLLTEVPQILPSDFFIKGPSGCTFVVRKGDISQWQGDALVTAANEDLCGGGGVDFAVHRQAGPQLLAECQKIPKKGPRNRQVRCPVGRAVTTKAYRLKTKYCIHAVGPTYSASTDSKCRDDLKRAYQASLSEARSNNCRTIALPSISCGAYMFPVEIATTIAVTTCIEGSVGFSHIWFCVFDAKMEIIYRSVLENEILKVTEPRIDRIKSSPTPENIYSRASISNVESVSIPKNHALEGNRTEIITQYVDPNPNPLFPRMKFEIFTPMKIWFSLLPSQNDLNGDWTSSPGEIRSEAHFSEINAEAENQGFKKGKVDATKSGRTRNIQIFVDYSDDSSYSTGSSSAILCAKSLGTESIQFTIDENCMCRCESTEKRHRRIKAILNPIFTSDVEDCVKLTVISFTRIDYFSEWVQSALSMHVGVLPSKVPSESKTQPAPSIENRNEPRPNMRSQSSSAAVTSISGIQANVPPKSKQSQGGIHNEPMHLTEGFQNGNEQDRFDTGNYESKGYSAAVDQRERVYSRPVEANDSNWRQQGCSESQSQFAENRECEETQIVQSSEPSSPAVHEHPIDTECSEDIVNDRNEGDTGHLTDSGDESFTSVDDNDFTTKSDVPENLDDESRRPSFGCNEENSEHGEWHEQELLTRVDSDSSEFKELFEIFPSEFMHSIEYVESVHNTILRRQYEQLKAYFLNAAPPSAQNELRLLHGTNNMDPETIVASNVGIGLLVNPENELSVQSDERTFFLDSAELAHQTAYVDPESGRMKLIIARVLLGTVQDKCEQGYIDSGAQTRDDYLRSTRVRVGSGSVYEVVGQYRSEPLYIVTYRCDSAYPSTVNYSPEIREGGPGTDDQVIESEHESQGPEGGGSEDDQAETEPSDGD